MIINENQLRVSKEKRRALEIALSEKPNPKIDPIFEKAGRLQLESLIQELSEEINHYEKRKAGRD